MLLGKLVVGNKLLSAKGTLNGSSNNNNYYSQNKKILLLLLLESIGW
jgi:hypothetical protein